MKSPENFKSIVPTPEDGDSLESQIRSLKQEGREYIKTIQQLIDKGEASPDPKERATIKQQAEVEMRKINKIKRRIRILTGEEMESADFTHEQYLTDLHPFLKETYKGWSYDEDQLKTVESVTANPDNIHIDEEIPFDKMVEINNDDTKREANQSQIGEMYITSESVDFETAKPFIPEIPEDIKKQGVSGVLKYIHETYKDTHILPDLKYYQYLAELADMAKTETDPSKKEALLKQIPEQLKDGNYYYFPGSAFVNETGRWVAPYLDWADGGFYRHANRVGISWGSYKRVVLLER